LAHTNAGYIFVAGNVMTNVVVAILLEKYLEATQEYEKNRKVDAELLEMKEDAMKEKEADGEDGALPVFGSSTAEALDAVKTKDLVCTLVQATRYAHPLCSPSVSPPPSSSPPFHPPFSICAHINPCRCPSLPMVSRKKRFSSCHGSTC
jgi:hypothetical protein